ncbi:MAG TPA: hypothetical protein DCQ51_13570 [Planktothrix sp. UBA8407]|nr:hypothetical protein [Planktothrix sp. UBA8407]
MVDFPVINHSYPLLVVIVNYRTAALTIDCLYSLVNEVKALPGTKVVVSDNASGDDSIHKIQAIIDKEKWGNWVSLIPLDRNCGYGFGNNIVNYLAQAIAFF